MSDTRPITWIIVSLLLLNVLGTGLILQELREPDEHMASIPAVVPSEQTDSISQPEAHTELIAEAPVQATTETIQGVVESPASDDSSIDPVPTEIIVARVNGTDIGEALLYSYLNQLAPPEQLTQWDRLQDVPQNVLIQGINNAALDNLLVQLSRSGGRLPNRGCLMPNSLFAASTPMG